jgi:hypothetical protein
MAPVQNACVSPASHRQELRQLMNEYAAAEVLGLKVSTLRRWRWAGTGPSFIKIGGAVRYDPDHLATFVAAGTRSSTSDTGVVR